MNIWIKYRARWGSGIDEWEWEFTPMSIDDFKDEIDNRNEWSHMYRGCDIELDIPPREVIVKEVTRQNGIRRRAEETISALIGQLDDTTDVNSLF